MNAKPEFANKCHALFVVRKGDKLVRVRRGKVRCYEIKEVIDIPDNPDKVTLVLTLIEELSKGMFPMVEAAKRKALTEQAVGPIFVKERE